MYVLKTVDGEVTGRNQAHFISMSHKRRTESLNCKVARKIKPVHQANFMQDANPLGHRTFRILCPIGSSDF
jgi:hypothetical protein